MWSRNLSNFNGSMLVVDASCKMFACERVAFTYDSEVHEIAMVPWSWRIICLRLDEGLGRPAARPCAHNDSLRSTRRATSNKQHKF